jgi:hypothetical protein
MFDLTLSQALGVGVKKEHGGASSSKLSKVEVHASCSLIFKLANGGGI